MSDTPRTDAEYYEHSGTVSLHHARQLERELAAANARADNYGAANDNREQLKAQLAAALRDKDEQWHQMTDTIQEKIDENNAAQAQVRALREAMECALERLPIAYWLEKRTEEAVKILRAALAVTAPKEDKPLSP